MERYQQPHLAPGVVIIEANIYPCFEARTAIEPANAFAIQHGILEGHYRRSALEVLYTFSDVELKNNIISAIEACEEITQDRKPKLLAIIDETFFPQV